MWKAEDLAAAFYVPKRGTIKAMFAVGYYWQIIASQVLVIGWRPLLGLWPAWPTQG